MALRALVRAHDVTRALHRGSTRFLVEDTAGFPGTRSARQRQCCREQAARLGRPVDHGDRPSHFEQR